MVDDGSSDATAEEARTADAVVISHPFNLGQGAALQTGIAYALAQPAEVIVTFDADGQHRVSDISHLAEALLQESADFALGSRFLGQAPNLPPLRWALLPIPLLPALVYLVVVFLPGAVNKIASADRGGLGSTSSTVRASA